MKPKPDYKYSIITYLFGERLMDKLTFVGIDLIVCTNYIT